jgi:hypothetical protein
MRGAIFCGDIFSGVVYIASGQTGAEPAVAPVGEPKPLLNASIKRADRSLLEKSGPVGF